MIERTAARPGPWTLAFRVVYAGLALNFFVPVLVYVFAPDVAVGSFAGIGEWFGVAYPHTEDSMFWRVLGIANVATLGFCCVLLLADLERWFPVLTPLVFLKSCASLGFLAAFVGEPAPPFLAASIFDALTVAAMWVFAHRALAERGS